MKKVKKSRILVTQSLERISRDIFSRHSDTITKLIGTSAGVYALYDESDLYYVGRATKLRTRVRQHLKDRHMAGWTHFSLYLVSNADHIGEIESLLIRIGNPKGNNARPKGRDSRNLHKQLEQLIKIKHKEELSELLPKSKNRNSSEKSDPYSLKNLVKWRTPLFKTFKGKEYKAVLTSSGKIIYKGKRYSTPTAAAKEIVKRVSVNGWSFWNIRDKNNEWVKLRVYKA